MSISKKILATVLTTAMVFALSGCGGAASKPTDKPTDNAAKNTAADAETTDYTYHWKVATTENDSYYMTQLTQEFLDKVSERTNGKVTGEIYHSGQLGNLVDALEGLDMGNVDIVIDGISSLGVVNQMFNAWGLPYLYDSKEHQYKFWDNNYDAITEMGAEASNIRMVCIIDGLNRQLSSKKPVNSIADLKGMKVRVPAIPAYARIWECLGASPVPMSFSEVFTSIQTGVVDAQENDLPLTLASNLFEVCKYAVITDHVAYEGAIMFNDDAYEKFPDDLKQIIKEVSTEITAKSRGMVKQEEDDALAKVEASGVEILHPDLAAFKEATKVMYDEYSYCEPVLKLIDEARNK